MKKMFFYLTIAALAIFAACAKKNNPAKTPVTTTYTMDVAPLIQAKCSPCHIPSRGGNKASFENHGSAIKYGAEMVTRIHLNPGERGFMPFKNPKLSVEDMAVFKKWVDGGMLEK